MIYAKVTSYHMDSLITLNIHHRCDITKISYSFQVLSSYFPHIHIGYRLSCIKVPTKTGMSPMMILRPKYP